MRENIKLAKKLFKTAENDLKAVEVLYNAGNYSISLFQLQQSVEKFVKSYGIRMEIIKPEDLSRKISHLPHKVFTRQYSGEAKKLINQEKTPILIPEMIPPHQRGKGKTKEKIKALEKLHDRINKVDIPKFKNITKKELTQFVEGSKELEIKHQFNEEKIFKDLKEDFIKTHEHFQEYFKQFNDDFIINDVKKRLEKTDEYVKHQVLDYKFKYRQEEKITYIKYVWVNLSLLTAPHEQSTRYPNLFSEETPEEYYTNENVVIEFIPRFIELMKKTVEKFNEVFE
jgi:HEPN domain-containing protein